MKTLIPVIAGIKIWGVSIDTFVDAVIAFILFVLFVFLVVSVIAFVRTQLGLKEKGLKENEEGSKSGFSFKMPEFQDSGWILLYKISGWILIIAAVIILFGGQTVTAIYFACMGLGSFFGAHVLRLLEKSAHHAEETTKLLKKMNKKE